MEDNEKYISKIKNLINILENHVPIGYSEHAGDIILIGKLEI